MFFSLHFAGARSHAGSPVAGVFDVAAGSRDLASARACDVAETRLRMPFLPTLRVPASPWIEAVLGSPPGLE